MPNVSDIVNNVDNRYTPESAEAKFVAAVRELATERLPLDFKVGSPHWKELKKILGEQDSLLLQHLCYLHNKYGDSFQRFLNPPENGGSYKTIYGYMSTKLKKMSERTLFRIADRVRTHYTFKAGEHLNTAELDFKDKYFCSCYQPKNSERSLRWIPNRKKIDGLVRRINDRVEQQIQTKAKGKTTPKSNRSELPNTPMYDLPNTPILAEGLAGHLAGHLAVSNEVQNLKNLSHNLYPLTPLTPKEKTEAIVSFPYKIDKTVGKNKPQNQDGEVDESLKVITPPTTCQIIPVTTCQTDDGNCKSGGESKGSGKVKEDRRNFDVWRDALHTCYPHMIPRPDKITKARIKQIQRAVAAEVGQNRLPHDTTLFNFFTLLVKNWGAFMGHLITLEEGWKVKEYIGSPPSLCLMLKLGEQVLLETYKTTAQPAAQHTTQLQPLNWWTPEKERARQQAKKEAEAAEDAACPYIAKYGQRVKNQAGITFVSKDEGTSGKDWTREEMIADHMRSNEKTGNQPDQDQLRLIEALKKFAIDFEASMREVEQYKTRGATLLPPCIII